MSKQLTLFNFRPAYRVEQPPKLMSFEALNEWKAGVFKYQQRTLNTEPPYAKRYATALASRMQCILARYARK